MQHIIQTNTQYIKMVSCYKSTIPTALSHNVSNSIRISTDNLVSQLHAPAHPSRDSRMLYQLFGSAAPALGLARLVAVLNGDSDASGFRMGRSIWSSGRLICIRLDRIDPGQAKSVRAGPVVRIAGRSEPRARRRGTVT
jgi:hypothetical protein